MEIRRITYKQVHGTLSGKLTFSHGENFLVGINGCGKTTVLNLIRWVLGPCLPELCTIQHELIRVDIKHGRYVYSIQSRISEENHELKVVTKDRERNFGPIVTPLVIDPQHIHGVTGEVLNHYRHLTPEPHELHTWRFLTEELPSPVFIGLERSIEKHSLNQDLTKERLFPRKIKNSKPVNFATTLMRDAFNTGRSRLVEINDILNRKVLELSFSGILKGRFIPSSHNKITLKKINQLKFRFESTISEGTFSKALSAKEVRISIIKYLDDLASLLKEAKEADDVWVMLNRHNFDRATNMFDLFEKHEINAQKVQEEISTFSNTVNKFIGDSGKSIHFNEETGVPYFKSKTTTEQLRLADLSSGEMQVVILLSYFAFLAKKGISIIIDEPELSLHVQWQKYFVSAVKEVMPEKCQTIMATHSPEICGAEDVNVQSISVQVNK